jgi:hypothetical protein
VRLLYTDAGGCTMKTVPHFLMTLASAWVIALAATLSPPALAQSPTKSTEAMLDALPITQDANLIPEQPGYQSTLSIDENLERLYGVGCVYELQYVSAGRKHSFKDKFAPLLLSEDATLRAYLDHLCSEGRLTWEIVRNAIHIRPTGEIHEKELYLDTVRVSLDLQGASLIEAAKAWATAVNRNRTFPGYGVRVRHPWMGGGSMMRGSKTTPPSLTRPGAVTLKLDDVTAREALCAIQGASTEWVALGYSHALTRPDTVLLIPANEDHQRLPQITAEERAALDAKEDLNSVLVEPEHRKPAQK